MSFWTALVVLFAIACVTWLKAQQYRAVGSDKSGSPLADAAAGTAREDELEREVEEMRKRIAVLERIATDERHGQDLARQIDSLRD